MDLMHIPREMLDAGNDTPVLSRAMERAEAPQDFYEKICRIYDKPFDTSRDEVVLKGGVIIDRYSAPMIDRDGGYCGRVWYFRDITEKKHADEVHLRFEAERHHSRMMELFIARLGHDLKTPITPVMALMPIVKTRVSDPELSRMLDICYQSVVNIRELTDKACKFVKLSSPPPESLTRVCLAGIVTEVLAENKPDLDQKGMDSILAIDPGLKVMAVSGQLRELFRNLITNAVRFSAEGGTISVSAQQTEHGISVAVRDNGAGIDPESLEHIFDEFYKADESRHNLDFPGLGLAICRKIVTNHHGRIWAESRGLGSGTTIHIALPRFE
jgi:signal transduction histidine kinase